MARIGQHDLHALYAVRPPIHQEAESIEETSHPRIGHDGGRGRDMFHVIQTGGKKVEAC